jgi:membrane protein YqaA with SNARE-associated domain
MALALSIPKKSFRFAAVCAAGSVMGGIAGYGIGYFGYEAVGRPIIDMYHGQEVMAKVENLYALYGFWGVLIAAITPIPYKVFTISSGFFRFEFGPFVAASIIGRSFRFFLVASLIYAFGPSIKVFIDKYFNILTVVFMALLVGGFAAVKYLM